MAMVQLEGLDEMERNAMTASELEPATVRHVA
jgi:hypothetical protein